MCGMGRTGTLHACEQEGIAPDLMAIAKGLGGGFAPIGAVLVGGKIFEAFEKGSGLFQHGHTYLGHPLACAGALAVQQVIRRDNLLANVRRQGEHLTRRLNERFGNHHHVGDVRGRGLFQAIELVPTAPARSRSIPRHKLHARIKQEAMARGLMVYPMGGTIDGAARRPRAAGAAVHRHAGRHRHHRRAPGRGRRRRHRRARLRDPSRSDGRDARNPRDAATVPIGMRCCTCGQLHPCSAQS